MIIIDWQFRPSPSTNDDEARPGFDGTDFLETLEGDYLGIDPPEFFRQHLFGRAGRLMVGRCSCGAVGCSDAWVTVSVHKRVVTWTDHLGRDHEFDATQYKTAFVRASKDTSRESVGRTAERVVSALDFTPLEERGFKFGWASTRCDPGRVTLSFTNHGAQCLFEIGWNEMHADDAKRRVQNWISQFC